MIHLTELKSLLLKQSTQPNHPKYLSAASGLVQVGAWLYVAADDELHLGKFSLRGDSAGDIYRCFDGTLPSDTEERKAEKPDIEVLTIIPHFKDPSQNALLVLGSGSKKNRDRGAIIPLDRNGNISAVAEVIDLSHFYDFLTKEIGKLNIEGATLLKDDILFFQRGNKKNKLNASIRLKLDDFYAALLLPHKHKEPNIQITPYDLGDIDQIPLCFTDATSLASGEIIFTASAEDTSDAYLDGACKGSVVGIINSKGNLSFLEPISEQVKVEGVAATTNDKTIEILLVTDADDASRPATLYSANIKLNKSSR